MALSPNVVVVAPGELITSTHHNNVRSNLDRLDTSKLSLIGGTLSGALVAGAVPTDLVEGALVNVTGNVSTSVINGASNLPNLACIRGGTNPAAPGATFVRFSRYTAAIGSITMPTATTVAYNTTSDPRLKERTGDVDDPAGAAQRLGHAAFRGRWINPDSGQADSPEWVLLSSHDVEDVAPFAVTGQRDAVTDDGAVDPQQVNYPALVPLLFAALADALDRLDALEGGTPP